MINLFDFVQWEFIIPKRSLPCSNKLFGEYEFTDNVDKCFVTVFNK